MKEAIDQFAAAMHAAGINPPEIIIADGSLHRFSTNGLRYDAAGWYVLHPSIQPHGHFGCWRTGISGAWSTRASQDWTDLQRAEHQRILEKESRRRRDAQQLQWARNAQRNAALIGESLPAGDQVRDYLASRGLGEWPIPLCIREHPGLTYWHADEGGVIHDLGRYPAMLAPVVRAGQLIAVHRTYLQHGAKAPVPSPRKLTSASGSLAGAYVPLADSRDGTIGIAEGIETAAAASLGSGLPVVAAYCAHSMARYEWPATVKKLVIFADNDDAGGLAANTLSNRAEQQDLATKIVMPTKPGSDWADVWKENQK